MADDPVESSSSMETTPLDETLPDVASLDIGTAPTTAPSTPPTQPPAHHTPEPAPSPPPSSSPSPPPPGTPAPFILYPPPNRIKITEQRSSFSAASSWSSSSSSWPSSMSTIKLSAEAAAANSPRLLAEKVYATMCFYCDPYDGFCSKALVRLGGEEDGVDVAQFSSMSADGLWEAEAEAEAAPHYDDDDGDDDVEETVDKMVPKKNNNDASDDGENDGWTGEIILKPFEDETTGYIRVRHVFWTGTSMRFTFVDGDGVTPTTTTTTTTYEWRLVTSSRAMRDHTGSHDGYALHRVSGPAEKAATPDDRAPLSADGLEMVAFMAARVGSTQTGLVVGNFAFARRAFPTRGKLYGPCYASVFGLVALLTGVMMGVVPVSSIFSVGGSLDGCNDRIGEGE